MYMDANPQKFLSIFLANWIHLKYVFQAILVYYAAIV